jgi:glycosyltransferase involved in cell wall biosynthesis
VKIGINLLWLLPGYGGLETYARGLLAGLALVDRRNEYVLFTNPQNSASFADLPPRFGRRLCNAPLKSRVSWRIAEQLLLSRYSALERLDVLHSPDDMVPLGRICPVVMTIHDVNFVSLSDRLPGLASQLLESWVRRSSHRADEIITVSEFSRGEISTRFGIPSDRISVIHNAPAVRGPSHPAGWPGLADRLGIACDYLIAFADGSPHKNLYALLSAFAVLVRGRRLQLVVVGRRERQDRRVRARLRELNLDGSVVFTDYLDDSELSLVLANARLLVFPSLYEGFGLPVVEAMAAGIPVACSRVSAMPEIAGAAAAFFNPSQVADMIRILSHLLASESLRGDLVAAGRRRVGQFSWERAALQTIEVYERAARKWGRKAGRRSA